ncbi:MAG: UDP-glucose 4-epimerase GalE [Victivallales bacterium]|nr:UDP-glucose 4-epimerase GalE [Victivallales bacterium]MBT7299905.1 UDP-glucose 4-epimerase GalE [Victivallales bacterium]
MKILVAGGAGFIGSVCTEYLLNRGHEVVVFDALINGHREAVDPRAAFVQGNLADVDAVMQTVAEHRPEGVIHFAAFIEVGESMRDPGKYFRNNVANGLNLLDACVAHKVRKIVFSSTAAVYGMPEQIPIPESEPTKPINPYGESKLMFERILHWYREAHGLNYVALRYFNAAGCSVAFGEDHHPESHLIPLIMQAAEGKRDCIKVFGTDYDTPDGTCIRDYVHVLDLSQAHLLALESDVTGAFNLGSGNGHSVRAIIDAVREVTGIDFPVVEDERRPGDPARLVSDSTAARQVLGWKPEFDDVREIVRSAWEWRRAHPEGYNE